VDDKVAAHPVRELMGDDRGHGHRRMLCTQGIAQLRVGLGRDGFDEDIDLSPAGQAHGEGLGVAHAVVLEPGPARGEGIHAALVDGPLDAPS